MFSPHFYQALLFKSSQACFSLLVCEIPFYRRILTSVISQKYLSQVYVCPLIFYGGFCHVKIKMCGEVSDLLFRWRLLIFLVRSWLVNFSSSAALLLSFLCCFSPLRRRAWRGEREEMLAGSGRPTCPCLAPTNSIIIIR